MVYLYGAGGHGKVVLDILDTCGVAVGGFFDEDATRLIDGYCTTPFSRHDGLQNDLLIITIGNNSIRKSVADNINMGYTKAIHPSSVISKNAVIKQGSVVMPGTIINTCTQVGEHCIINSGAIIEHDCVIGSFVHIAPNATLCGGITIGEGSLIGAGSVILPGVQIGKWCVVGAGSVVLKNLPDNTRVAGNPAKVIRPSR